MSVKVIKKEINKELKDELGDIFAQMVDTGDKVNLNFALPKYVKLRELSTKFLTEINALSKCDISGAYKDQLNKFFTQTLAEHKKWFSYEPPVIFAITEEQKTEFAKRYKGLKESDYLNIFAQLLDEYKYYTKYMKQTAEWSWLKALDVDWCPFKKIGMCELNIQFAIIDTNTPELLYESIKNFYNIANTVFNELMTPDIDIDRLTELISQSINNIKNMPELRDCKDAFDRLLKSSKMLKENFGNYYRDFIVSKSPNIIIENFILDVSHDVSNTTKNTKRQILLMRQFSKIVKYYKANFEKNKKMYKGETGKHMEKLTELMELYTRNTELDKLQEHEMNEVIKKPAESSQEPEENTNRRARTRAQADAVATKLLLQSQEQRQEQKQTRKKAKNNETRRRKKL